MNRRRAFLTYITLLNLIEFFTVYRIILHDFFLIGEYRVFRLFFFKI